MSNVMLFFNGIVFSSIAVELFKSSIIALIFLGRGSVKNNFFLAHLVLFLSVILGSWLAAIFIRKFSLKKLLFLSDFIMSGYIISLILYMKFFLFGTISCIFFLFIGGLIIEFSRTLNKFSIPLLSEGNQNKLSLNSFDLSITNVSRVLIPLVMFFMNGYKFLAVCILVSCLFFYISGVAKYSLVIPEIDFKSKEEPFNENEKVNIFGYHALSLILGGSLVSLAFSVVFSNVLIPKMLIGYEDTLPGWIKHLAYFFLKDELNLHIRLYFLLRFTSALGMLLSVIFLNKFAGEYSCMDGIKFANYCLAALSFLMSFMIFFFRILGKGNPTQLFLCLVLASILFSFVLNLYFTYLAYFYQLAMPYKNLICFMPMFINSCVSLDTIGGAFFSYVSKKGPLWLIIILLTVSILNSYIFKSFKKFIYSPKNPKEDKDEEKKEK